MRDSQGMRFLSTTGPIVPTDHYCVPPLERLDLGEVRTLIRQKRYFVPHTPRQTGKTSALRLAPMDQLDRGGGYRCVCVDVGQAAREDMGAVMRAILRAMNPESQTWPR